MDVNRKEKPLVPAERKKKKSPNIQLAAQSSKLGRLIYFIYLFIAEKGEIQGVKRHIHRYTKDVYDLSSFMYVNTVKIIT